MIRDESFWACELEAPLLNRNAGFITRGSVDKLIDRAQQWRDLVNAKSSNSEISVPEWTTRCPDPASQRIFELDAERTFRDSKHRQDLAETLSTIYQETQDYHQGLGFITSFLLLFLDKKDVAKIVLALNKEYVPGYFKAAPVAYVRDAKTYEKILEMFYPAVHKHVTKLIPAEAYCSKWFVGFNVHVLPFPALADFLDAFFASGEEFRFQYAMALIKNTERDILATNDVAKVLALLRLDAKEYPDVTKVLGDVDALPGSFFHMIASDAIDFKLT